MADFQVHCRKNSFVAILLNSASAYHGAHDIEMGVVHGIALLRSSGDHPEGLGVDDLRSTVGGFSDLAHPDASIHAGHAHTRGGDNRSLGSVLGQRCR